MICPRCKAEYREGFFNCADCDVALVSDLQGGPGGAGDEGEADYFNPDGPLHATHDSLFMADLVDALESALIPYAFEAGTALDLLAGGEVDAMPGIWEARIHVHGEHRGRAREILLELQSRAPGEPVSE